MTCKPGLSAAEVRPESGLKSGLRIGPNTRFRRPPGRPSVAAVSVDVRAINEDEVPAWVEAMRVGFLGHAGEGEADFRRPTSTSTATCGGFDGDRVVGTLRSFATDMTRARRLGLRARRSPTSR